MSGGLIQKLQAAEIQRDKYKEKFKASEQSNIELIRLVKKLDKKLDRIKKIVIDHE